MAAFPGLVQGFFVVPDVGTIGVAEMLGRLALWVAASVALFVLLDTYLKIPANRLPVLAGAVAFSLFYFHTARRLPAALHSLFGGDWGAITWPLRIATISVAVVWVIRSFRVEGRFLAEVAPAQPVRIDLGRARAALAGDNVEVAFGDTVVVVPQGTTLLEAAETAGVPIEAGCRQGVCGADPVAVIDGIGDLSPPRREESDTLLRLGLGEPNRMACVARAHGIVLGVVDPGHLAEAEARRADVPARPRLSARRHRRQRHRWRDHRRLPPTRPRRRADRRHRRRAPPPLQPHGDLPGRRRPLGDAGSVPAAGSLVRRPRHHGMAEHAGRRDRPQRQAGPVRRTARSCRTTDWCWRWAGGRRFRRSTASGSRGRSCCATPPMPWP